MALRNAPTFGDMQRDHRCRSAPSGGLSDILGRYVSRTVNPSACISASWAALRVVCQGRRSGWGTGMSVMKSTGLQLDRGCSRIYQCRDRLSVSRNGDGVSASTGGAVRAMSQRDGVVGPRCDYQRLWGTGWRNVHDANGALRSGQGNRGATQLRLRTGLPFNPRRWSCPT